MPSPGNLVHETSATTGTGNLTLASENGKQRFSDEFGTGPATDVFDYFISNRDAAEWEVGTGHMSEANTLVRDTVVENSNGDTLPVTFSAGTKDVTNDVTAAKIITTDEGMLGRRLYLDADKDTYLDPATDDTIDIVVGGTPIADITATVWAFLSGLAVQAKDLLDAQADVQLSGDIDGGTIAADTHDWNPAGLSTASVIRVQSSDDANLITGMAGGADGRIIIVRNIGSLNNVRFSSENASSTAANRFQLDEATTHIHPNAAIVFQYDSTWSRWGVLANSSTEAQSFVIAASDEVSPLSTGTAKATFRMPYKFTLTEILGSLTTAGTTASMIVDVNLNGTTLMTTNKLQFLSGAETDDGNATLTTTELPKEGEITIDIDSVHTTPGKGLKVTLIGFVN